jgi:D-glycero-alpha-D-manno-heptose-7-phosphate kinase
MIISRTPLRVSLFGGGSDLPEFYEQQTGKVLSFAINKYIYIASHNEFDGKYRLSYSRSEEVQQLPEISHPIFRHTLIEMKINNGIEIGSFADIPSKGSGLGSSSAFTVGLIANLLRVKGLEMNQEQIAAKAFHIERNLIGDTVGQQDHYGTAIGGVKKIVFSPSGKVEIERVQSSNKTIKDFQGLTRLVYTGIQRNASEILREQGFKTQNSNEIFATICDLRDLVDPGLSALEKEDFILVGKYLNLSWEIKKRVSEKVTYEQIDLIHQNLIDSGIWGAKLLGAGGGGFFIGVGEEKAWERFQVKHPNTKVYEFNIDHEGVTSFEI